MRKPRFRSMGQRSAASLEESGSMAPALHTGNGIGGGAEEDGPPLRAEQPGNTHRRHALRRTSAERVAAYCFPGNAMITESMGKTRYSSPSR